MIKELIKIICEKFKFHSWCKSNCCECETDINRSTKCKRLPEQPSRDIPRHDTDRIEVVLQDEVQHTMQ